MRKFILQLSKQFGIVFLFYVLLSYTVPGFPPSVGEEVDYAQYLAQNTKLKPGDTVRIGDSVGKNINPQQGYKDNTLNLCSNQAISVLGQILILETVLNNNSQIDNLVIEGYLLPSSFNNNLNNDLSMNYFIKKFYTRNWLYNISIIDSDFALAIDSIFLAQYKPFSTLLKLTKIGNNSPLDYFYFGTQQTNQSISNQSLLTHILNNKRISRTLQKIKFMAMPVPKNRFQQQNQEYCKLQKLGLKLKPPIKLDNLFFNGNHLKGRYKKRSFYDKIITDNKNDK